MKRLVGNQLPDFKLKAVSGNGQDFIEVSKKDYEGKWLVLFFWPLDFTFVCPTEITSMSKKVNEFAALGAQVLGVSTDSIYSHKAWIEGSLGEVAFPLASDMRRELSEDLGILIKEESIALRGLYIVNPEGEIKYSVVHDLNVGRSAEETLRVLSALQTGGLCPADWHEGDSTL